MQLSFVVVCYITHHRFKLLTSIWWSPQQQRRTSRWTRCWCCPSGRRPPVPRPRPFCLQWWKVKTWKWAADFHLNFPVCIPCGRGVSGWFYLGCCCGRTAPTRTGRPQTPPGGCRPSAAETSACGWTLHWLRPVNGGTGRERWHLEL